MKRFLISTLFIVLIPLSCRENDLETNSTDSKNSSQTIMGKPGLVSIEYQGQQIQAWRTDEGDYVVNDDILLDKESVKELNSTLANTLSSKAVVDWDQVTVGNYAVWPKTNFNYKIDPSMPAQLKTFIQQAVAEYITKTNSIITFTETAGNNNDIFFKKAISGCNADMGYKSGRVNTVNLSETCDKISVIHEIGHVLGMIHEHQRLNRNDALKFKPETFNYIKTSYASLYNTVIYNLQMESSTLNDPFAFDLTSVMLYAGYPRNAVALANDLKSRNLPFYTKKDGSEVTRPTIGLSDKDIDWLSYHYSKKLVLKNIDYNTLSLQIQFVDGISIMRNLNQNEEIQLIYNMKKKKYTYTFNQKSYVVDYISLNGTSERNDILFKDNNIFYDNSQTVTDPSEPYVYLKSDVKTLIGNYTNTATTKNYFFTDPKGINGGSKNAIIEARKQNDKLTYINIKKWGSTINTDGKSHTFNKNVPTELYIRNLSYDRLGQILIRLGCTICFNPGLIALPPYPNPTLDQIIRVQYSGGKSFTYGGNSVTQISLNNGAYYDDLNFGSYTIGNVTYQADNFYIPTLIDFDNGYIYGTLDKDGIDGKSINAQIDAYMKDGKMYIDILK
ncbi:M12 family metallopeptidase [Chryseobacterium potabilaquae]|uniref:Flavastacin n=1 Tax=Chryseobacterium potabilaquae TaxID=2675057 RepID=A0A6N4X8C9_9FLAO|nr:M12 family metallopeptidase [Chryseobacterium potabilaquae]CAA7195540.1 Flavastacin [Chryseobacterium potabilaquae]